MTQYLNGFDVSHWQGDVDFKKLKAEGNEFSFAKATDGRSGIDSKWTRNRNQAASIGLPSGSYHFYQPDIDPLMQAKHFCDVVGKVHLGELPPVMDWEQRSKLGLRNSVLKMNSLKFLEYIEDRLERTPVIYMGSYWINEMGDLKDFTRFPLWIASYRKEIQTIGQWDRWTFWQYTDSNGLDKNYFNGSIDDLRKLTA